MIYNPGKSTLYRRSKSGLPTTPASRHRSAPYGAMACCDGDAPVCTIQPTACVDNYLHPASALCTGNCPNDDMTLKCTADIKAQCKLAHAATPIVYLQKPSYGDGTPRQRAESSQGRSASLNQVVRGWYCGQMEPNTDPVSQYLELSTLGQVQATIDSAPSQTSSSDEMTATKTHSAAYPEHTIQSDEAPQPNPRPAVSESIPNSPAQFPSVETSQTQTGFPGNENCDWLNEYGECCNPSDQGYYRRRRRRQVQRLQSIEHGMEKAPNSSVSKIQVITYTRSTAIISRPMTTSTPVEAADMPIVEAIYVVSNTYENQTDVITFQEATRSHTILLYSTSSQQTTRTVNSTHSLPPNPRANTKSDPRAGMKAGIAIGAIVVIALVLFVFYHFRSRRKARQAMLERDAQPGPTRGWRI